MKRHRIIYILSKIDSAKQFELVAEGLRSDGVEIEFILLNSKKSSIEEFLQSSNFNVMRLHLSGKLSLFFNFVSLLVIFLVRRPRIVHTHLMEANLAGLTAAWIAWVPMRVYTRHHSIIHHQVFPAAVKWDKFCNWLATHIVAPSETISNVLKMRERVDDKKIFLIHHGFDLDSFRDVADTRISTVREKYDILEEKRPVIGCVARYTEWKGVQFIVKAFQKILQKYPNALLVLCNAQGDYSAAIKELLAKLPSHSFLEIHFEEDMPALYKCFNIFVHAPTGPDDEAFGQIYVEAMAAGVPTVFTMSGVAKEIARDQYNTMVVDYKDAEGIVRSIDFLLSNLKDTNGLTFNAANTIDDNFSMSRMRAKLFSLYSNMPKGGQH
ncbi:MAG: glycosyltransferase family 4 protein [Vicingaceae bacterium]